MNLVIADGHNLLFKAYGVPFKFASAKGTPLHVVTTYLSMLRRSLAAVDGKELIVVFDSQEQTSNHELLPDYKANRDYDYSQEEDSPFNHLPIIKNVLSAINIPWLEIGGIEADDIIATLATKYVVTNQSAFIVSTDTDFLQLIDHQIKILKLLPRSQHQILDHDHVVNTFGVTPQEYIELKSLVGDKADNIKGLEGIGWKKGLELFKGVKVRNYSEAELALIELNRKLITLTRNLEINLPVCDARHLVDKSNNEIFSMLDL